MKIVVLDGYTENPGDLSWAGLEALGELKVYDRVSYEESPKPLATRRSPSSTRLPSPVRPSTNAPG